MRLFQIGIGATVFFLLMPTVFASIGFGPAEMYTTNKKDTDTIGTAILINNGDTAKYGVFRLLIPFTDEVTFQETSDVIRSRVLCKDCGKSMQLRNVINDVCMECGSPNLRVYTPIPRDEYEYFSLSSDSYELEQTGEKTWKTSAMIPPGGKCEITIQYPSEESYLLENKGKNWEAHLRGSVESGGFVVGGIDLRVLITFKFPISLSLLDTIEHGEPFRVKAGYYYDGSLRKPDVPIVVDFNGVKQSTDVDGVVTFMYPQTRHEYTYTLRTVENDLYLSETMDISTSMGGASDEGFFSFLSNIYVLVAITLLACIIVIAVVLKRYFVWE